MKKNPINKNKNQLSSKQINYVKSPINTYKKPDNINPIVTKGSHLHQPLNVPRSQPNDPIQNVRKILKRKLSGGPMGIGVSEKKIHDNRYVNIVNDKVVEGINDIMHKKSTGDRNWSKFLQEQNIKKNTVSTQSQMFSSPPKIQRPGVKLTKVVAIDCEMVGIGEGGRDNMLARVSIVNAFGDCIYDKFVKPREPVTDYRTPVSGVRPEDIENAENFETVQREVAEILRHRILVGHSLKNDMTVLYMSHPKWAIRDTSKYFREPGKGTPSLKKLALQYLGVVIQEGEHSSVEDAKAAVQLYNLYRKEWEAGGGAKNSNHVNLRKTILPQCN